VEVTVKPSEKITPGIYLVSLSIDGDKGDALEEKLKVYINPATPAQYAPALSVKVDASEKVDPREPVLIKLYISNQNSLNLTGVKVKLQSEMPEFNKVATLDISPLGKKELEFSITPNPVQQPKVYTLTFAFERFGEDFKVVEQSLEIVSLLPAFSVVEEEAKNVYLKIYRRFTVNNPGNVLNTQEVKVPVSFLQGLLMQEMQSPVKVKKEIGQRYSVWEVSLGPEESTAVYAATNYRWLVYALIIIALLIWFYWYAHTPLVLKKTSAVTKRDGDGAISEMRVTIEVKNHSGQAVKDVEITDVVPTYANFLKATGEAEVHPHRTVSGKEGTTLHWSLGDLESKEQRVLVYRMKAKLNILGSVTLPRAVAEFARSTGRRSKAYSGRFKLAEEK
jgi:hypothetical protein